MTSNGLCLIELQNPVSSNKALVSSEVNDDALETSNTNRESRGDAGLDLYCPSDLIIPPHETGKIDFKIQCEGLSDNDSRNVCYYLYPRSSISKTPLRLANSVGIIDAGYRGYLMAAFHNLSDEDYIINPLQRLVQICSPDLKQITFEVVNVLSNTQRGEGGFGSTS